METIVKLVNLLDELIIENEIVKTNRMINSLEIIATNIKYNGTTINIQDSVLNRVNLPDQEKKE